MNEKNTSSDSHKTLGTLSLLAALFAACCAFPALLAALGVGLASGVASWFRAFDPYRPFLLGLTAILFGYWFTRLYLKRNACDRGIVCSPSGRIPKERLFFWLFLAISLLMIGIPWYRSFLVRI